VPFLDKEMSELIEVRKRELLDLDAQPIHNK
jgi:hypothetical protein